MPHHSSTPAFVRAESRPRQEKSDVLAEIQPDPGTPHLRVCAEAAEPVSARPAKAGRVFKGFEVFVADAEALCGGAGP